MEICRVVVLVRKASLFTVILYGICAAIWREILGMGNLEYIFTGVLGIISIFLIVYCLFRGKGTPHRKLIFFTSLLGVVATVCFGGGAILACFDMGWRCTPFNIMLFLCAVLFIITLWRSLNVLSVLEDTNPVLVRCGFIAMMLMTFIVLAWIFIYFQFLSWHDSLSTYNGQMIVCSNDMHGGSCSWRYYTHINSLVHGVEITRDGWWGTPPF